MSNNGSLLAALNAKLAKEKEVTQKRENEQLAINRAHERITHGISATEAVLRGAIPGTDRGPENE